MERLNMMTASPRALKAWSALEGFIAESTIDKQLVHLVKLRCSQINGCAFCVDMHSAEARKDGDSERRLYAVSVWHETPFFTPRERAALQWAETMTRLSQHAVSDADYAALAAHFSAQEMMDLTVLISTINGWNRLAVGFGRQPA